MRTRTEKIAKNIKFATLSQFILVFCNFIVRKVFVLTLGEVYLGLNGLFGDILSMLSLAELGFGTAIVFSLYKPLSENDTEKIKTLMRLFMKAYRFVGIFVIVVGLLLTPFLNFFIKEMPVYIPYIQWIYILNVINSGLSYFFIYKASLLFADQKKYMEMKINMVVKSLASVIQIVVLLLTKNYFLYLAIMIAATLGQNIMISVQVDHIYPFLKEKKIKDLEIKDLSEIRKNVGAMAFHKLGYVVVFSTDSIIMAKYISVAIVGIYSNYMLIRKALLNVIDLLFVALAASMGNLNACETEEKKYEAYNHIYFMSAWLFGFISICLFYLYNPFIYLWLGKKYLLPPITVGMIVFNFYMYCMRMPINNTKDAMGLFWYDRYKPIAEVIINLGMSMILVKRFEINGILCGTLISTITVPFIVEPYILYKKGLKRKVINYYIKYGEYLAVTLIAGWITGIFCQMTNDNMGGFLCKIILCFFIPNSLYILVYGRTEHFYYLFNTGKRLLKRSVKKEGK